MNNSTAIFTTPEVFSDSMTPFIGLSESVQICVYGFGLLFGLPTQFYVVWLIVTESGTIPPSEFFSLNLSVCEIVNFLNCLLFILTYLFSSFLKIAHSISGLGITGRPLFECLMCVERYLAVVHPVTFLKFKPLRYRVIFAAAAWIISLGSCIACRFLGGSQNFTGHSWFFSVQFLVFLSIQLSCCLAVLRALKRSGPGERGREREEENHMKRRAFHLILITTVNMIIIYVPIIVTGVIVILIQKNIQAVWIPSNICYVMAGFVQPVLYLHRAGKLSRLCPNMCIC
ncbi:hydroxycarboxylic acid receptor 2-like [Triplophysa rosa]|uniref:hydroxycarboxylic acid receptor 2-like n=1 Tax=Triplophysa rosa TaxID=992332 RepID=UPI002545C2CA|nr:hydroxycarboxylic acid receptor 2-like [Triplophysa rosa]